MTQPDVVRTFLNIPYRNLSAHNWGTACDRTDSAYWYIDPFDVGGETERYINGILLTVDGDFWMGRLIEVVERITSTVTFAVIVTYYGAHRPSEQRYDYEVYPEPCGVFFERTPAADYRVVSHWGVDTIYRLSDAFFGREHDNPDPE